MDNNFTSEYVSDFLDFLNAASEGYHMAQDSLQEAEDELLDILHFVELEPCNAPTRAVLYKRLREARKKRRMAKDNIALMERIDAWKRQNVGCVKSLEQLLGELRKEEKHQQNRGYAIRSHVLDDLTEKTRLF